MSERPRNRPLTETEIKSIEDQVSAKRVARVFGVTPERTPMERAGWAVPPELHKKRLHPGKDCPGCKVAQRVEAQLREAVKEERLACAQLADDVAGEYESETCLFVAEKIRERVTGM